ncbi:cache domain-containing sensor histidine kinase [Cohnella cholangitidis]|uniref:HAMP domain-containing protein n=1 Tax=Cohnella cholangitidis TaxID=2598458 RepID=A0A7G5C452_9BACL|nr:sensor histidine kinase [Cohnella cholangitidis]QMV43986.1 HAMP domain-containing protein [Cohnella cholangitidis]
MWRRILHGIGQMKLRSKLMVSFLVASIIPIVVISLTVYQLSAESVEEASQEFASMYISQATTNLDDFVQRYDQTTRSVLLERNVMKILSNENPVSMDQLIENKAEIRGFFGRMMMVYPEIETMMLVGVSGTAYHYTKAPDELNLSVLQDQPWYEHYRTTEKQMFITPVHNRSYYKLDTGGAAFTVGRILWNYNGSYAGMLLIELDPSDLIKLSKDFLKLGNRYDIRLIITDEAGGIIYHSDAATGKRPWEEIIGQHYRSEDARNNNNIIVLSDKADKGKLSLSTEIPIDKLLANINSIKHVTLMAIVACLLFIVTISIVYSYKITRPIQDLRKSMKQVELGHYSTLIHVPASNDEISGLVLSYNKMILRIKELIEDVFLAGMKRKQAQFLALQTQINPHMLYNTLESIRMKAIVKDQDEIAEMIKMLARMFKHSLRKEREQNLVRHEVEYASNYIFLQNIRYEDRFVLEIELSEEVLNAPIIPLVFQPIVENSIKHGFRDYATRLHIRIEERRIGNDVLIRIMDNGMSLTPERAQEINRMLHRADAGWLQSETDPDDADTGIGLRNISERLKLQYGERYFLNIGVEQGNGTVVEMLIPLRGGDIQFRGI